ncbi:peptidylprolyl isomerase [Arsenicicoccus dermatophilus]
MSPCTRLATALLAPLIVALAAPTASAVPHRPGPQPPAPHPTTGACAFTPMKDTSHSTYVGMPPDPRRPRTRGRVTVVLHTQRGHVPVVLDRAGAPCAAASFEFLARHKYFDGTSCHRLTAYHTPPYALSVLQCGDPLGTGEGDPGYSFMDELTTAKALNNWPGYPDGSRKVYPRGTLAMANSGPDTNGSQFFLVYADSRLRPDYTVFGHVTPAGMKVLDQIAAGGIDPGPDGTPEDGRPRLTTTIHHTTTRPGRR